MLANFVVNFLNTSLFTKLLLLYTSKIGGGAKTIVGPPNENWGGGASAPRFYRQRTPCTEHFTVFVLYRYLVLYIQIFLARD